MYKSYFTNEGSHFLSVITKKKIQVNYKVTKIILHSIESFENSVTVCYANKNTSMFINVIKVCASVRNVEREMTKITNAIVKRLKCFIFLFLRDQVLAVNDSAQFFIKLEAFLLLILSAEHIFD